ncbi:fibulin-1 isoform X1 [Latimeria chalumnae]|uniref:fibulin-1 isoform X1 n=1 Tax=Latimeria chalumnae TaxID=7897 RepID=UPI0003C19F2C|nr:PREDICTED: fibulin-1 isoform X1 [Latimeria chalumnae]|eukprot:XP_005994037.1 PREDICTED: fibulin-1 isoform X1 [Latimeria chalumnae]
MDTLRKLPGSLLFSLVPLFVLSASGDPSVDNCCTQGQEWATRTRVCSSLPFVSDVQECRFAQQQCCIGALEDFHCTSGINMANEHGECETQKESSCEANFVNKCCKCCLLGKKSQIQGLSCEQNLKLGYQCGLVYRACCEGGQESTTKTPPLIPLRNKDEGSPVKADQEDPYRHDRCRGGGPCKQQCIDTGTKVICSCFVGFKLSSDEVTCEDINECLEVPPTCRIGEQCINTVGSFHCVREMNCGTGYLLTENNLCLDINECEVGTHNCAPGLQCQNTQGSFRCKPKTSCGPGYIQDALGKCNDINECMDADAPCPVLHTCINTIGSYICQRHTVRCGRGYHLSEDGSRCVDVDECLSSTDNACKGHICINTVGTFRCECATGYYFDSVSRSCSDINECRRYSGRLCAHKCDNTPGSYYCSCAMGFKLSIGGRNCEDVNECESNPCSQECANVYGSYQCYCRRGYQLSDVDGVTCEDIDECALPTGGHICSYRCTNVPGSFQCACPPTGYVLAPNGRSCQDIDECVTGAHNCSGSETCFNVQGSFQCLSFDCPENYRKSGDRVRGDRTETIRCIKSCQPNDANCILDPVHTISHTVISLPTFREFTKPEEIVFLRAISPSFPTSSADIIFDITEGNSRNSFDIIKRYENGMPIGVVRQVKPIVGPFHSALKLEMNYVVNGVISHRNIVYVHIYVSEYWF